ncbi:trypsin-like peptidase domain-containing protein [Leptospira interrogans]|uniref:Trypsin-like peptidase domain protein n=2 Tax=Leptospira interrogans serovar Pyrogenes TaxID=280500 RepID=M7A4J8_LEPIR|nr:MULTISPECIES: trypsin-like peptidase domain-containing protein [Leptospira]EMN28266.1 trypsin-like peptidase domain protein [Leptospira interrogans serovar Pyrogenes str. L0374]EMP05674.1 trypsin-like peptidase domain protein [Leptospira interrogans serovar Pyrogenes str. 200701872]EKO05901.1 trypsin-like peptidase domain protein [Leptospira interrogans str. C10069]EMN61773.1 trypsin-like peptidase domain protein [Leptospira interrogans serovar Pyrogenes str. R168]ULG84705.1 trypsin-like pe
MSKKVFLNILILLSIFQLSAQNGNTADLKVLLDGVVIIRSDTFSEKEDQDNYSEKSILRDSGTGMIISGNRILTNAHVVSNSSYLKVKHFNSSKFYKAEVQYLGFDCDLAILKVEEDEFFSGVEPLEISEVSPALGSNLLILGYPGGDENITLENGNVSRVERVRYSFSGLDYRKAIRVNANIIPGYSGGPAIQNGRVVGITFQVSQSQGNVAYLIPPEIINHFLKDVEDGTYHGFPFPGFSFQNGHSSSLKSYLKIPEGLNGILINTIYPDSSFSDLLQPEDFVYKIDNSYLDGDGGIMDEIGGFIGDLIEEKFIGDHIKLFFYRNGKNYKVEGTLKRVPTLDIYRQQNKSSSFLSGGFLFQPVNRALAGGDSKRLESSLRYHYSYYIQDELYRFTDRDILLSGIYPDPLNSKYASYRYKILESINDRTPSDLEDFKSLWKKFYGGTISLKFRGVNLPIILDQDTIDKINIRIKKRFDVEADE